MKETIVNIIAEYKGVDVSEIDTGKKFSDLGLDSLDMAELSMTIEDQCGVTIDLTPEIDCIDKLVEYIEAAK